MTKGGRPLNDLSLQGRSVARAWVSDIRREAFLPTPLVPGRPMAVTQSRTPVARTPESGCPLAIDTDASQVGVFVLSKKSLELADLKRGADRRPCLLGRSWE